MATPPQGRKMAPERPFPILIETGKSDPKTGLLPAVSQRFSDSLPAASRRFAGGSTAVLPVVRPRFPGGFRAVWPAVCRQLPGGLPAVCRRFSGGLPAVFRQFCRRFSDSFAGGFPTVLPAVRQPFSGNTLSLDQPPVRLRPLPSIRKKRQETSAIPYTLSRLQTQHSGIFKSVFVTKRLAKLAGTNKH